MAYVESTVTTKHRLVLYMTRNIYRLALDGVAISI